MSGEWIYDANDRLTQRGAGASAATYQFDAAGSLTSKTESGRITRYFYDTQNRLVEIQDGSNNPIARYGYDPLNRRIWKEQYRHANGELLAPARRTYYLYADEGLIAEATQAITLNTDARVTASAAPRIATQYGPRPNAPFTTGLLFIKTNNSNGQATVAYYHHDHLNTPLQATDKAGAIVWAARYHAFGAATIITPTATTEKPTITSNLRLPGQYEDEESGLYYNWNRYYDAGTGRYVTADPIGLVGGINTYAYVGGNPVGMFDPSGLDSITLTAGGAFIPGVGGGGSAGFYVSNKPFDIGVMVQGETGGGIDVGGQVKVGYQVGPISGLSDPSINYNVSLGPVSGSYQTDAKTGEFQGVSIGPAVRAAASITYSKGATYGLGDFFEWFFERFLPKPKPTADIRPTANICR